MNFDARVSHKGILLVIHYTARFLAHAGLLQIYHRDVSHIEPFGAQTLQMRLNQRITRPALFAARHHALVARHFRRRTRAAHLLGRAVGVQRRPVRRPRHRLRCRRPHRAHPSTRPSRARALSRAFFSPPQSTEAHRRMTSFARAPPTFHACLPHAAHHCARRARAPPPRRARRVVIALRRRRASARRRTRARARAHRQRRHAKAHRRAPRSRRRARSRRHAHRAHRAARSQRNARTRCKRRRTRR